jgi:hypothetical protein
LSSSVSGTAGQASSGTRVGHGTQVPITIQHKPESTALIEAP